MCAGCLYKSYPQAEVKKEMLKDERKKGFPQLVDKSVNNIDTAQHIDKYHHTKNIRKNVGFISV